jgi:hypothetical protein
MLELELQRLADADAGLVPADEGDGEELPERAADDREDRRDDRDSDAGRPCRVHGDADERPDADRDKAEFVLGHGADECPSDRAEEHNADAEGDGLTVPPARRRRRFVHNTYFTRVNAGNPRR